MLIGTVDRQRRKMVEKLNAARALALTDAGDMEIVFVGVSIVRKALI
jgi:hypothetical protein